MEVVYYTQLYIWMIYQYRSLVRLLDDVMSKVNLVCMVWHLSICLIMVTEMAQVRFSLATYYHADISWWTSKVNHDSIQWHPDACLMQVVEPCHWPKSDSLLLVIVMMLCLDEYINVYILSRAFSIWYIRYIYLARYVQSYNVFNSLKSVPNCLHLCHTILLGRHYEYY